MDSPVVARDLVKAYRDLIAVRGISFSVSAGECFGFLGPNGAGKSSTMRMISCVSPVTSGDLHVNGLSVRDHPRKIKAALGVVPQEDNLDEEISVLNNLLIYAGYFGVPRDEARRQAETALELFQLTDKAHVQVNELSGGMKRRLLIARGLINQPKMVLLDEPTTGLDPQARHVVWRTLRSLREQGVTLLLTTHYMEEAAALCDRLVVMHEGRIVAEGTPADLVRRHVGEVVVEVQSSNGGVRARADEVLRAHGALTEESGDVLYAYGLHGAQLADVAFDGMSPTVRPGNLEDVFLRLTGHGLQE
jgi:lipooligosaccharide transport system ATP-binding protein